MTAAEAKALTLSKKMTIDDLYKSIEAMAKSALAYSTHDLYKIADPEAAKKELEGKGFVININERFFEINW